MITGIEENQITLSKILSWKREIKKANISGAWVTRHGLH